MLNKKSMSCVLALAVLLSPSALIAQNVKVQTGPAVTLAPGLGAAGSVPSIQLTNVSLASPLMSAPSLAAPLYPALTVAPIVAAAAQPRDLAQPVSAAQPVKPQPVATRALNAVKKTFGGLFSRKESAPKTDAPDTSGGSSMFDGSRKLLATVLTAAIVCAGGCSKDPVEPMYDGGYPHMDDRPATAQAAADMLNDGRTFDASEAFAAKLGYNTWDEEYHLGVPHRNDFALKGAHYTALAPASFDSTLARLGLMPVDQAVGTKLVYIGGAWQMIADDYPSDYWASPWYTSTPLYSVEEVQDYLNAWIYNSEAFDAKVTGDDEGRIRVAYPDYPLSNAVEFYWDVATFDTYLEAMTWSLEYLDAVQNRGMKVYFSPYDVSYVVLYPIEYGKTAQRLGVSQQELQSAIDENTAAAPAGDGAAKAGRYEGKKVDWKGVFSKLKMQAPAPLRPIVKASARK